MRRFIPLIFLHLVTAVGSTMVLSESFANGFDDSDPFNIAVHQASAVILEIFREMKKNHFTADALKPNIGLKTFFLGFLLFTGETRDTKSLQ